MNVLPKGWVESSIEDIGTITSGFGFPERFQGNSTGELPFAKVSDISQAYRYGGGRLTSAANYVSRGDLMALKARTVSAGSIAFAKIGEALKLNRRVLLGVEAVLDNNCMAVTPHHGAIFPQYLYRFMTTIDFAPFAVATTVPSIRKGDVGSFRVPLPPLVEQKRIVAKLDAVNAKTSRARTELARIETLVSRYRQAVLNRAFSRELTREWPSEPLGQLSEMMFDGPFGSHLKSADYVLEGPRVVRLENIGARVFVEEKRTHISEKKFQSLERHLLKSNDLLFSSFVSEEIRACLFPPHVHFKAINKADCFCIRLNSDRVDPQFALFQLTSEATYLHFVQQVHGATRPRINLSQLKQYPILAPPLAEQQETVRRIESAFAKIDRLSIEAKRALKLIEKLDETILAKAFRGELVPQDENDEPATHLLARIRAGRESAPKAKRWRGGKA